MVCLFGHLIQDSRASGEEPLGVTVPNRGAEITGRIEGRN
jgi:hypothetical protein